MVVADHDPLSVGMLLQYEHDQYDCSILLDSMIEQVVWGFSAPVNFFVVGYESKIQEKKVAIGLVQEEDHVQFPPLFFLDSLQYLTN